MPRQAGIPKELRQRLDRASHSFLEMAHGVGDAPKIPFPEVKAELSRLHDKLLVRRYPQTTDEAERAANTLERHLEKWAAYAQLKKAHATEVALGNYKNAARIKKSLDTFHARLFAPKLPAFLVPHAKNKSTLVLSFSHPNKTAEHSRQNAQYLAKLLDKELEKDAIIERALRQKPRSVTDRLNEGEAGNLVDFLRKKTASELLKHFKMKPNYFPYYAAIAKETYHLTHDQETNRIYEQADYARRVAKDRCIMGF